jgi:predicted lipoprotein with Yx(FWY)xxD motif
MSGPAFTVRLFGAAATILLASACGSSTLTPAAPAAVTPSASTHDSTASSPGKAATPGGLLGEATTSLGPVLVDSSGLTVYLLTADTPGHSTCSADCLEYWPPVPAPTGTAASKIQGISAPVSVTKATSGASMVTAGGWPLYTFTKDKAPGDVTGQGVKTFGGTWYAVSSSGTPVKTAPTTTAATTPATSTPAGGNGY